MSDEKEPKFERSDVDVWSVFVQPGFYWVRPGKAIAGDDMWTVAQVMADGEVYIIGQDERISDSRRDDRGGKIPTLPAAVEVGLLLHAPDDPTVPHIEPPDAGPPLSLSDAVAFHDAAVSGLRALAQAQDALDRIRQLHAAAVEKWTDGLNVWSAPPAMPDGYTVKAFAAPKERRLALNVDDPDGRPIASTSANSLDEVIAAGRALVAWAEKRKAGSR